MSTNGNGKLPHNAKLTAISAEEAVVASIACGRFNDIPAKSLVPAKAFFDPINRMIYGVALKQLRSGITVCEECVSDFIENHNLERDLQKFVDPTKTIQWRFWPQIFEAHKSASLAPTTYSLEYALESVAIAHQKRERLSIAERIQDGTLSDEAAIEELRQLSEKPSELPPIINAADLCACPPETPAELIEGVLHQGSKLVLGGGSKSFKTWTLLEMAISVATGRDWLGFQTTAGRVLYVNFELPEFSIEKRINEICKAIGISVPRNLELWNLRGHAADAEVILPKIAQSAEGRAMIILDPLYKLLGSRDENASRDMANLMNAVERLAEDTGAAVAFGSHFAKGNASGKESMDRISGSGVFARDPDSIVTMTQHEQDKAFTVEMTLRNFPPQEPFVVRREHPLMVIDGQLDPAKLKQVAGRTPENRPEDLMEHFADGMKTGEWQKACADEGISRRTFYRLRKELVAVGKVFLSEVDEKWSRK
jgi:hypothetical protein